ncbi:MAG: hypothetical protein SF051_03500 [Elusimicrobiota bacterium]|nr:hypothetical protein [Elusimicrobiota bacterium]
MSGMNKGDSKKTIEPWEREMPRLLMPPVGATYTSAQFDVKKAFPANPASRWALGLLVARNDLSISLKLIAPFMIAAVSKKQAEALYQTSIMTYFWRTMLAQVYEAWILFNRGRSGGDEEISKVCETEKVEETHRALIAAFAKKTEEGYSARSFLRRCRASTFHYYDDEGDTWPAQLEIIQKEPFFIAPKDEEWKAAAARYITADEWVNSRINPVGFGSSKLHSEILMPAVFDTIKLVDACTIELLRARGVEMRRGNPDEPLEEKIAS